MKLGLHVAGYNFAASDAPGFCHVHISPEYKKFDPQPGPFLSLPTHVEAMHLRNGMIDEKGFDEFNIMWPALSGIDETFRNLLRNHYPQFNRDVKDLIAARAEWLGNWVKQMCLAVKLAGFPERIGKTVKVLTFNKEGEVRWFALPEMGQIK
jgi:hypothetical protein